MKTAAMSRARARAVLGFLTVAALFSFACGGGQLSPDGGSPPAAVCGLPFDPGPCRAAIGVYAAVNGTCVPRTYGGCDGNDNRFSTLEECMAVCEGRPLPYGCPAGRIAREICLACGPAGGCPNFTTVCALSCDATTTCPFELPTCYDGVCQQALCE
jgi:hypothetical protein